MSANAAQRKPAPRRRWARIAGAIAVLLLLLALALRVALQPEHVTGLVLGQLGKALGLEITASGPGEYRLGGSPVLVVRGVVAREPGAKTAILRAERVLLSLPWSTIRSRGDELTSPASNSMRPYSTCLRCSTGWRRAHRAKPASRR